MFWRGFFSCFQNLLGYNEKSDIYSLGVVVCEIANGLIPFSEMPNTYMLLEKMKGTEPKLLDSSTYEIEAASGAAPNHDQLVFSGQKPADSGVGASVGSCSNLPKSKNYTNRTFSDLFHEFVELCCFRDADDRKSASELLQHSFIKQLKKSSSKLSLATLVTANDMITVSGGGHEDEDSLTMAMDSKMIIDEIEWDFSWNRTDYIILLLHFKSKNVTKNTYSANLAQVSLLTGCGSSSKSC